MAYKISKLGKQNILNDLMRTCRVCMKKSDSVKNLFHSDTKIVEEIQFCAGILVSKQKYVPSQCSTEPQKYLLSAAYIYHSFSLRNTQTHTSTAQTNTQHTPLTNIQLYAHTLAKVTQILLSFLLFLQKIKVYCSIIKIYLFV